MTSDAMIAATERSPGFEVSYQAVEWNRSLKESISLERPRGPSRAFHDATTTLKGCS